MHQTIGELVGLIALLLCIAAFASKDDDRLLTILIAANVAFAVQFAAFGAFVASAISAVIILRIVLARRFPGSRTATGAILVLTAAVAALTWSSPIDIFPLTAGLIGTYAMFMLRGIPMRLGLAAAATCWAITNFLAGSMGALAAETLVLATNVVTIVRLAREKPA
ncbi:YgjV family protein [Pararhizobium haloflavum]|uniref:YgjV family protein n=1 Tax=Pararhizobium haloflavum TaxID=2037914 RepID=UPI001FE181E4|nr:YgjV family protein [Pararhizobium haloflavum]